MYSSKKTKTAIDLMSWGMYPKIKSFIYTYSNQNNLKKIINKFDHLIAYGNGRSYGDSAIGKTVISTRYNKNLIDFDFRTGIIHAESGILLSEILSVTVPRGWFLKVCPGTKFVTIGGAIASDVHGKNHHKDGCFSECVQEFDIMLENGEVVTCSKKLRPELFRATCGGQGLTGIIVSAKLFLKKINSQYLEQTVIKTSNLKETFNAFEENKNELYSVAWIDCLAKGTSIGKCLLSTGDFINDGKLDYKLKKQWRVYFNFPKYFLNTWTIKIFNWIYYNKSIKNETKNIIDIDSFFFPLDLIEDWNRVYGKNGFLQYQFILPKEDSYEGLNEILEEISNSGNAPFLGVLKLYGKANTNYLSFPLEGYSLALDFKVQDDTFKLLNKLDEIVNRYNGRIYLTKDARVCKEVFEKGYPQIQNFRNFRKKNKMDIKFQSLQSKRVQI